MTVHTVAPVTGNYEELLTGVAKSFVEQWSEKTRRMLMDYLAPEAGEDPDKMTPVAQRMMNDILKDMMQNQTEVKKAWMTGLNMTEDDVKTDVGSGGESEDEDDEWQDLTQKEIDEVEKSKPLEIDDEKMQSNIFGTVVRLIDPKSEEAKTPQVRDAIDAEMNNLNSQDVFDLKQVMEWSEAKQKFPDAVVVGSRMILAEKNAELLLP